MIEINISYQKNSVFCEQIHCVNCYSGVLIIKHYAMKKDEFEKVLVEALPFMLNYALKLTGDEDCARDLVQEVAVKVLSKYYSYVSDVNFNGWLSTIIYNTFVNERKRESRCVFVYGDALENIAFCDIAVDERELKRFVDVLPQQFGVLLMMLVSGYSYCEIAKKLDLPMGTVKSRIHKVRNFLREYIRAQA